MRSNYTCIFLRQSFVIADTNMVITLNLGTYMDDGLVAWINGVELPRQNAPYSGELSHTNTARLSVEASRRTVSLTSFIGALRNGTNVLAVQALNFHRTNDDFRIDVELAETPSMFQFFAATYTVPEAGGQVVMRVLRTNALEGGVTVDYATTNGTALAGAD